MPKHVYIASGLVSGFSPHQINLLWTRWRQNTAVFPIDETINAVPECGHVSQNNVRTAQHLLSYILEPGHRLFMRRENIRREKPAMKICAELKKI